MAILVAAPTGDGPVFAKRAACVGARRNGRVRAGWGRRLAKPIIAPTGKSTVGTNTATMKKAGRDCGKRSVGR